MDYRKAPEMLTAGFHFRKDTRISYNRSELFATDHHWICLDELVLHFSPENYHEIITLRDHLNQFIQESLDVHSSLPNGDRLDNSRDVPELPAEGI